MKKIKNKRKTKEKGITLIALVITIVILIILATVTLNVVLGEGGLIDRAKLAKEMTEEAVLEEQQGLNSLMSEFTNIMAEDQTPPGPPKVPETIEEAKPNPDEDGQKFEDTTTITDDLDNSVTIPGGFHIDKDSGTKVEEGVVIEDDSGNQFVWIPVGEYNVSTTISSTGKLTNELSRRKWGTKDVVQEPTLLSGDEVTDGFNGKFYCGEGDSRSCTIDNGINSIDAFKASANTNKGFYIGRYEQGTGNVCAAGVDVYVDVTRDEAKQQAEVMYSGNQYITSQLISSYAWDTALNFICQTNEEGYLLATTRDETYGNFGGISDKTQTGAYIVNGQVSDKYSNIHDFLGNCYEWTTEYSIYSSSRGTRPCVNRGRLLWIH